MHACVSRLLQAAAKAAAKKPSGTARPRPKAEAKAWATAFKASDDVRVQDPGFDQGTLSGPVRFGCAGL